MTNHNAAFESGMLMVCAQNKIAPNDAIRLFEKHAALRESPMLNRELLKIGSAIMREGGYEEEAQMFDLMQSTPMVSDYAKSVYVDPVLETLGCAAYSEANAYQEKQASFLLTGTGKVLGMTPDAAQLAAALSVLGGMGVGGAYWALNRDANTSDEETTVKEEQAKYYRNLAKVMRRKMREKGIKKEKTPELVNKPTEDMLPANETYYA